MGTQYNQRLEWKEVPSYRQKWAERNMKMLSLIDNPQQYSYTEYGCGPFRPFYSEAEGCEVHCVDICEWDFGNIVFEFGLSEDDSILPNTDIAVMSGVLEYIDDQDACLDILRKHHKKLLFSISTDSPKICDFIQKHIENVDYGWANPKATVGYAGPAWQNVKQKIALVDL